MPLEFPAMRSTCRQAEDSGAKMPGFGGLQIDAGHPRRQQVEAFIARRFHEVHGALVSSFMPVQLAMFDGEGEVAATLGIRNAGFEPLYLEHYLERPVEQVIAARVGSGSAAPDRDRIVEIGNLASRDRRASRRLFALVAAHLQRQGFDWAVLTGGHALQRMFGRLGIETITLCRALQGQLPADQQTWGSYYEDSPVVVAGRVSQGVQAFAGLAAPGQGAAAA